jgi:hypothetical protein
MQHRSRPFRRLVLHARQYRARLLGLPRERLRGVVRGSVYRYRNLVPGGVRRTLRRRLERLLRLYELRFKGDGFMEQMKERVATPLPRRDWLPGGYAHWRTRSGTTSQLER